MADWVRLRLPWNWEGLEEEDLHQHLRDLAAWVSWFVARHHLVGKVPACWYRHPGLTDELSALWHYHQEVTNPLVLLVQPNPVGAPEEPEDREVAARSYQDWHEARWPPPDRRGPLAPLREDIRRLHPDKRVAYSYQYATICFPPTQGYYAPCQQQNQLDRHSVPEEQGRWAYHNAVLMRKRFSSGDLLYYFGWFTETWTDKVFARMHQLVDEARREQAMAVVV